MYLFNQGITAANGVVSQWNDQSGNGRHLVQATAANRMLNGSKGANVFTGASGTNWSGSGTGPYTHTAGSVVALSASVLTVGARYIVSITIASRTVGSVTPSAGSTDGTALSANAKTSQVLLCADTTAAAFTPSSDFDGSVTATFQLITADGTVSGDGIQRFLKTASFPFDQPVTIFIVFKQNTWVANRYVFDGNAAVSGALFQVTSSPNLKAYAGDNGADTAELALNTYGVVMVIFDHDNNLNLVQVNNGTPATDTTFGTNDMDGFTLARPGAGTSYGDCTYLEAIPYPFAYTATQRDYMWRYAQRKFVDFL